MKVISKLLLLFFLLSGISINSTDNYQYVASEINVFEIVPEVLKEEQVLATYDGFITAYGPDCQGCSGITASGQDVRYNIYYDDSKYGKVHIVAADKSIKFGSIIRIKNIEEEPLMAIVLDRGSAIGFNRNALFDLLYPNEKSTDNFGKKYASIELLRSGF